MKKIKQSATNLLNTAIALLLISTISSCSKTGNTPQPDVAFLSVVQASPDAPATNLFLNGVRINNQSINYNDELDYFKIYAGKQKPILASTTDTSKKVSGTFTFVKDKAYSLFLAGRWANASFVFVEDNYSSPAANMVKVRFINLSPDAAGLDVATTKGDTITNNKVFKKYSNYVQLKGDSTYTFVLKKTGTAQVMTTLQNVTLDKGGIYTIYAKGLSSQTGSQAFGADIINNSN